jgi:hypothetical protein
MAHYIAEQITAAEAAGENDRQAREQASADSILALWQRRAGLPGDRPPMHAFEHVFSALDRLAEPQAPWRFYRPFPEGAEPGPEDFVSSTLLSLALDVEDSAREIVRTLISEAAGAALDREAQWVRLSETLADDQELQAVRHLHRLIQQLGYEGTGNPGATEPLERVRAQITRTIEQLTAVRDAIAEAYPDREA